MEKELDTTDQLILSIFIKITGTVSNRRSFSLTFESVRPGCTQDSLRRVYKDVGKG